MALILVLTGCEPRRAATATLPAPGAAATAEEEVSRFVMDQSHSFSVAMDYSLAQILIGHSFVSGTLTITTPFTIDGNGPCCPRDALAICNQLAAEASHQDIPIERVRVVDIDGAIVAESADEGKCELGE